MSDEKYYVRFRGRTLGPFDTTRVRDLIKRGQVTRMHELSPDGVSWQPAEVFPELFPASAQPEQVTQSFSQPSQINEPAPAPVETGDWYAHLNNENKGPVTKDQLAQWIASGALTQETLVWQEGREDWEPANIAVPELFSASPAPDPDFATAQQLAPAQSMEPSQAGTKPCPFCAQMISSVAIKCQHCQSMLNNFCSNCGTQCGANQAVCLNCGTAIGNLSNEPVVIAQPTVVNPTGGVANNFVHGNYNKTTAAILAFFLGGLGAHKFYHGSFGWGIIYIVFVLTFVPAMVALVETIMYLAMSQTEYDSRYNLTPPEPFKW